MAKRREFLVITDFNTRHEMVRKETYSMREALRDASARAKRGITAHVVARGARGQTYVAACSPREAGGYAPGTKSKTYAKCFIWDTQRKILKRNYRGQKRRRAALSKKYGV